MRNAPAQRWIDSGDAVVVDSRNRTRLERMTAGSTVRKELLHRKLRAVLCAKIYANEYPDGGRIPAERELALGYGLSRVTVRSTLAAMQAQGLVSRRQGHGTRVTLRTGGFPSIVDPIAVIAPAQNPFFASFIRHLEAAAEAHDALVVFKQATARSVVDSLFSFYQRDIRNAVLWPYDEPVEIEKLQRLRGLGMNLVLFDRTIGVPWADCVTVDNGHAVRTLRAHLAAQGARRIGYLGWENDVLTSNLERETAFVEMEGPDRLVRIPWTKETGLERLIPSLVRSMIDRADALLCGNGVIGIEVGRYVRGAGLSQRVACVDDLPGASDIGLTAYSQPMDRLSNTAYRLLAAQSASAGGWKAGIYRLEGSLVVRA